MKAKQIYRGKAKTLYEEDGAGDIILQEFNDDITAGNGLKHSVLKGKGSINNEISAILFKFLSKEGIPTHFLRRVSDNVMEVRRLDIFLIEFVVRNRAATGIVKRLGIKPGLKFSHPIIEYYLKSDTLGDPLITEQHIKELNLLKMSELERCTDLSFRINKLLSRLFGETGIILVDIKFEFGLTSAVVAGDGILLGDEISPDTMRLWEMDTGRVFDKDIFRKDLGDVLDGYREVLRRLKINFSKMEVE